MRFISNTSVRTRISTVSGLLFFLILFLAIDVRESAIATTDADSDTTSIDVESDLDLDSLYTARAEDDAVVAAAEVDHVDPERTINGHVSWYGPGFHGRRTANGERFNQNAMTAAHKKLPFGTIVRVVDEATGNSVLVRINDRGPYIRGRVLDLSKEAASRLGMRSRGTCSGEIEIFPMSTRNLDLGEVLPVAEMTDDTRSIQVSYVTFDADHRGVSPTGFAVLLSEHDTFEKAINAFDNLRAEHDRIWLTRFEVDGEDRWVISTSLTEHRHLADDRRVELLSSHPTAAVIEFDEGLPIGVVLAGIDA